jgi:membrane protease YdiL (CAAX protease family)
MADAPEADPPSAAVSWADTPSADVSSAETTDAALLVEPVIAPTRCSKCYFIVRTHAQFCAHCGAPQPRDAQAVSSARVPDLGHHLLVAAATFVLPLGTSLALILAEVRSVGWLRLSEAACLLVGLIGMATLGPAGSDGLRLPRGFTLRGVGLTIGGTLAALAAAAALSAVWPMMTSDVMVQMYVSSGYGRGTALFDYAVLAPLAEELAFRGVLLMALVPLLGETGAVWASALLFATLHLSPISFMHLVLLGVIFARLRLGTGSVYPGMLVHGLYNAVVTVYDWRAQ